MLMDTIRIYRKSYQARFPRWHTISTTLIKQPQVPRISKLIITEILKSNQTNSRTWTKPWLLLQHQYLLLPDPNDLVETDFCWPRSLLVVCFPFCLVVCWIFWALLASSIHFQNASSRWNDWWLQMNCSNRIISSYFSLSMYFNMVCI